MPTPGFIPDPPKKCPKGHDVGTRKGTFRCGVEKCGHVAYKEAVLHQKRETLDLDAMKAKSPAEVQHAQRLAMVGVPKNLKAEEARQWAEEKLQSLLPEAVASIAWDLRYGSDKARAEATDRVLKSNGMDKKEAASGGGGTIVLNLNTGESNLPWLKRVMPKNPVVETLEGDDDAAD